MFDYNKDKEFNKIGRCWLCFIMNDNRAFYEQIRKEYDEDLYLMYDHLRYLKKRLNIIFDAIKYSNDTLRDEFQKFSKVLVDEITTMIYSKEIHEKYND